MRTPTTTADNRKKLRHEMRWKSAADVISSRPPPIVVWMTVTPKIPSHVLIQKGTIPMPTWGQITFTTQWGGRGAMRRTIKKDIMLSFCTRILSDHLSKRAFHFG